MDYLSFFLNFSIPTRNCDVSQRSSWRCVRTIMITQGVLFVKNLLFFTQVIPPLVRLQLIRTSGDLALSHFNIFLRNGKGFSLWIRLIFEVFVRLKYAWVNDRRVDEIYFIYYCLGNLFHNSFKSTDNLSLINNHVSDIMWD